MKKILKGIMIISVIVSGLMFNFDEVNSLNDLTSIQKNKNIEIYSVKNKEEVIINNGIVNFYEVDPNKEKIIEYIAEQERLEQERIQKEKLEQELKKNIGLFATQFVGNPYVLGGNSLTNGTDCSGFVQLVYATFGYSLPRTTVEQAVIGNIVPIEDIKVGDIVAYGYDGYVTHTALYIGNGKIVHASTPELGIRIDNIAIMPIITIRRVI